MGSNRGLAELIGQASGPVSRTPKRLKDVPVTVDDARKLELEALLHLRDGFVALGGALLVRPTTTVASTRGVEDWNMLSLWRTPYKSASEILFFADTVTGTQFGIYRDEIVRFDPDRGTHEHYAFALDVWAGRVIEEADALGRTLLETWRADHPAPGRNERLQPRVPPSIATEDPEYRVVADIELMRRFARWFRERADAKVPLTEAPKWWWDDAAGVDDPVPVP